MNKMKNLSKTKPDTFETVLESLKKTDRMLSKKFAKTDRILSKKFAETDRMIKQNALEAKERAKDAEERFKKLEQLKDEVWQQIWETEKIVKENSKNIGGIGNSNGKIAESYFLNNFTKNMTFAGQVFDSISSDLTKSIKKTNLKDEYDIVLYNGTSVVIIEVKYTAEKKNVEQTLKKAKTFKQLFPEYAHLNLYLGLAGLHFDKDVEKEANTQGIAIIKQVGDNMVIYDEHLKVF